MSCRKLTCRNGSRVDGIGEVDLDERPLDRQQGVAQGHAGVGQAAGIHDGDIEVALVQPVDEGAFVVRLEERRPPGRARRPCARSRHGSRRASRARRSPARACRRGSGSDPRGPGRGSSRRRHAPRIAPTARSTTAGLDAGPDDDAVLGREDPAQRARRVLLVGREVVEHRLERVGQGRRRKPERVQQAGDPVAPVPAASRQAPCRWRRPPAGRRPPPRRGGGRCSRPPPRPRGRSSAPGSA